MRKVLVQVHERDRYGHLRGDRGFLLKLSGIGRIIGQIGETCTWKRRSADDFLYKRDL